MPKCGLKLKRPKLGPFRVLAALRCVLMAAALATCQFQTVGWATQAPGLAATSTPVESAPADSLEELERLLTALVARETGLEWSDEKKWGQQIEVQDGIRFRRDDGRLETERTWKKVNHGRWEKYAAQVRPGPGNINITLPRLATADDGSSLVTVRIRALVDLTARISQWTRGVQLFSFSAEGWTDVELELEARVSTAADWSEVPPAMVIRPEVLAVRVTIHELQLDRVSKLGGEFSQQLGQLARNTIEEKIRERESGLVERLNRKIGEQADRLRFSVRDVAWPDWLQQDLQAAEPGPPESAANPASGG